MNYQKIHDQIIERAKTRVLIGYKERHHIIPRCMGGTNNKENLIDLTAREHFIIHLLLAEIHNTPSLWRAVNMLSNWGRSTSKQYQRIKENLTHSEQTKQKMRTPKSESHRNNMKGPRINSKQYIELTTGKIDYLNGLSQFFNIPASSIHWNTKINRVMKSTGLNFQEIGNPPDIKWDINQRAQKKKNIIKKINLENKNKFIII
jgi:hypothetical protein